MNAQLRALAATAGWRMPFVRELTSRAPVVLIYHGVGREPDRYGMGARVFEEHVRFLGEHFEMVGPDKVEQRRTATDRVRVMLTFDDGLRNNAEVVAPILERYGVPGVFFVSTLHLEPRRYLWFSYLRALEHCFPGDHLEFRGQRFDLSAAARAASMSELRDQLLKLKPHPSALYEAIERDLPALESFVKPEILADRYEGMSAEQLRTMSRNPLFTIGGHTADHPLLTQCEPAEALRQMAAGKRAIEAITGRACELFAYPGNAYDQSTIDLCRQAGFQGAYSEHHRVDPNSKFELPRIGVYYPLLAELGCKVRWSGVLRGVHQWKFKN